MDALGKYRCRILSTQLESGTDYGILLFSLLGAKNWFLSHGPQCGTKSHGGKEPGFVIAYSDCAMWTWGGRAAWEPRPQETVTAGSSVWNPRLKTWNHGKTHSRSVELTENKDEIKGWGVQEKEKKTTGVLDNSFSVLWSDSGHQTAKATFRPRLPLPMVNLYSF